MSKAVDNLLEEIRNFRHNYARYEITHAKYLSRKLIYSLTHIRALCTDVFKEIAGVENVTDKNSDAVVELDKLLRIEEIRNKEPGDSGC